MCDGGSGGGGDSGWWSMAVVAEVCIGAHLRVGVSNYHFKRAFPECEDFSVCQVFSMYQGLHTFVFSPALTLWLEFAYLCYNCVCIAFFLSLSPL